MVACASPDALSLALYGESACVRDPVQPNCTSAASEIHSSSQQGELEQQSVAVAVVRVSAARTTEGCCTKKKNCSGVCLSTDFPAAATKPQLLVL